MNRREENKALKDLESLDDLVDDLKRKAPLIIVRGTHDSGIFAAPKSANDPERGTPPPSYNDPTGETATSTELVDGVTRDIKALVAHLHYALNIAKKVLAITPFDVADRAKRNIPDCAACGDPIVGKIHYGRWDDKCRKRFQRWVEDGNPPDEKLRFELMVQSSRSDVHPS